MEEQERPLSPGQNLMLMAMAVLLILALMLGSGLILILFGLLVMTNIASALWGRHALARLEYERTFSRSRCFVGEEVDLTLTLTNRKLLPVTYLQVEDMVPEPLQIMARRLAFKRIGQTTLRLLFGLSWYQKVIRRYRLTPTRRGYYELGPVTLRGGDPFGYVNGARTLDCRNALVVYPQTVPLEKLGIPTRRPFGDLKSRDRLFEDPMRFAGVRDYQPGDPLSRVHWKATASSGRLQVKLLDPSSNMGLAVFLNTWGFDIFWQGMDESVEVGCTVAASIVQWATEQGLAVGLYANGLVQATPVRPTLRMPPARGEHVLPEALEGLARLQMPTRDSVAELMALEVPGLSYGTSVVVITRLVSDELAGAILDVQRSGRPVTLVMLGGTAAPDLPGVRVYQVPGEEALHAAVLA